MPVPKPKAKPATPPVAKKPATEPKTSVASTDVAAAPSKRAPQPIQLIRGMRDILPADQIHWKNVQEAFHRAAEAYGFDRIDTPLVEDTNLFVRGVGKVTDIVEKEMFSWETPGNESISLRPEGTASIVRAYVQHGMLNLPQPVKLWYLGPMFRYERPQAGRFRQHFQGGFECIGESDAVIDAQLIIISWNILRDLGLDPVVKINSLGSPESRANYKNALVTYFRSKKNVLSEEDKKRLLKNPMRLLDSKDPAIQELKAEAPQIVDWLDEESKAHFMRVLEYLDEVGVPYQLDPYLVRGLDYYTKTVFEWYASSEDQELAQSALGGGGRYDGLVEQLGGRPTPSAGFGLGLDRIVSRLKEREQTSEQQAPIKRIHVFLAQLGDMGRKRALSLFEDFRKEGLAVGEAFAKTSLKSQMETANRRHARWTIVIGQKEVLEGTAILRDMDCGTQEIIDAKKAVHEIKKRLAALKDSGMEDQRPEPVSLANPEDLPPQE
ncbi:histidine--tRNA ligase [Patescibacteria group bacterium]|nr:histidine--tRNA ligase [Patescibacteria group bacterium]